MSQLKVFIGWSKEPAGKIAVHLQELIELCVGNVAISRSHTIPKGAFSGLEISSYLDESLVGVFCLTRNNKRSHWMHWEAGALSAGMKQEGDKDDPSKKRVCPILFGIKNFDLDRPFQDLQTTNFEDPEDMKALIDGLAERHEGGNSQTAVDKHWKSYWTPFQATVTELLKKFEESGDEPPRADLQDWQERLLQLTLQIKQGLERGASLSHRSTVELAGQLGSYLEALGPDGPLRPSARHGARRRSTAEVVRIPKIGERFRYYDTSVGREREGTVFHSDLRIREWALKPDDFIEGESLLMRGPDDFKGVTKIKAEEE
ncbi:MAG: hypothetical protein O7H41_19720 [Planctomycetota bacterium]|nr:hypothetical protein [Planctomycetota bacterium]